MLSENAAPHDWTDLSETRTTFLWWEHLEPFPEITDPSDPQASVFQRIKINGQLGQEPDPYGIEFARPSSYHPGGVNVAFAGGNVRFISEELTYHVYILLMTPNGRGAKDMDGLVANYPNNVPPFFQAFNQFQNPGTPLNEKDIIP
jgi:prepilin-type processing-associated H-X9-DG protein